MKNPDAAVRFLSYVNYYRFSGYSFIFKNKDDDRYFPGASFEAIVALYDFDRLLRSLVADGLATIEVYARTKIAHFIAMKYGAFGHARAENFADQEEWRKWRSIARKTAETSIGRKCEPSDDDSFQKNRVANASTDHFRRAYNEWPDLPIWVLPEIMTFGSLARLFSLLPPGDRAAVAKEFNLKSGETLNSWFHSLSAVRNACAHFERIWNRTLRIAPSFPKNSDWDFLRGNERKMFSSFTIIKYVLDVIAEKTSFETGWRERFVEIVEKRPKIRVERFSYERQMGLPGNWLEQPLWGER